LAYSVHSYRGQCIKHVPCPTPDAADQFTSQPVATRGPGHITYYSLLPRPPAEMITGHTCTK